MKSVILCSLFLFGCDAKQAQAAPTVRITETKVIQLNYFPQSERPFKDAPSRGEPDYSKGIHDFPDLGMNNVPVLDQGQYGTCVTFSTTAALDALIGLGDFISQQCSLDLDYGIGQNYWDGAMYPSQIIVPLQKYGVVSKPKCPRSYPVPYFSFKVNDYSKLIDNHASSIIKKIQIKYFPSASLDDLKKAIDAKHRVLLAFTLDGTSSEAVRGFNVVVNGKNYKGGLWSCQQGSSANHCVSSNAGHEVLVIGYDDAQQLIKIRNSWDVDVGYNGDYFMSYVFLQTMGADLTEVW